MKLCILIGSVDISGGSFVIFEHALHLAAQGIDVRVVPLQPVSKVKNKWHPALDRLRFASFEEIAGEHFDLAMATWWPTVYELHRVEAERYCYFVQSIESWFYPDTEVALRNFADATYRVGLPVITEARWIKTHLADRFGLAAHLAPNGCRKDIFRSDGPHESPRQPGRLRVLVEGPFGVDFKNVARTIALLRKSQADEIWLLTPSPVETYAGVDRVFSRLPAAETGRIYRSCDVLVKLSTVEGMFGPPLEMFHCGGTAVVYDVTGYDQYIVDGENAIVVKTGDERAAIEAVNRLKRDPQLLLRLKSGALRTAEAWPDWPPASRSFEAAIKTIMQEPAIGRDRIAVLTGEFKQQYLLTERALKGSLHARSIRLVRSGMIALSRWSPLADRTLRMLRARLIEERSQPAKRTRK